MSPGGDAFGVDLLATGCCEICVTGVTVQSINGLLSFSGTSEGVAYPEPDCLLVDGTKWVEQELEDTGDGDLVRLRVCLW
jgi:hypothetical protein